MDTTTTLVDQVTTAMVAGVTDIAAGVGNGIAAIIPVAIPILAGMVVIGVCIRIFHRVSGV